MGVLARNDLLPTGNGSHLIVMSQVGVIPASPHTQTIGEELAGLSRTPRTGFDRDLHAACKQGDTCEDR